MKGEENNNSITPFNKSTELQTLEVSYLNNPQKYPPEALDNFQNIKIKPSKVYANEESYLVGGGTIIIILQIVKNWSSNII